MTTIVNPSELTTIVSEWATEDKIPVPDWICWTDETHLIKKGEAGHWYAKNGKTYLYVHSRYKGRTRTVKGVLWHEYCHYWTWYKYGANQGHNGKWFRKMFSNVKLTLYGFVIIV